jgi:hypothetical protein
MSVVVTAATFSNSVNTHLYVNDSSPGNLEPDQHGQMRQARRRLKSTMDILSIWSKDLPISMVPSDSLLSLSHSPAYGSTPLPSWTILFSEFVDWQMLFGQPKVCAKPSQQMLSLDGGWG